MHSLKATTFLLLTLAALCGLLCAPRCPVSSPDASPEPESPPPPAVTAPSQAAPSPPQEVRLQRTVTRLEKTREAVAWRNYFLRLHNAIRENRPPSLAINFQFVQQIDQLPAELDSWRKNKSQTLEALEAYVGQEDLSAFTEEEVETMRQCCDLQRQMLEAFGDTDVPVEALLNLAAEECRLKGLVRDMLSRRRGEEATPLEAAAASAIPMMVQRGESLEDADGNLIISVHGVAPGTVPL